MASKKVEELLAIIEALQKTNEELQKKLEEKPVVVVKTTNDRIQQVLMLLLDGPISTPKLATSIGIDARNIGSQLSYLRERGFAIGKDGKGWHDLKGWSVEFIRFNKTDKRHAAATERFGMLDGKTVAEIKAFYSAE